MNPTTPSTRTFLASLSRGVTVDRWRMVIAVLLLAVSSAFAEVATAAETTAEAKPNVLFIAIDDLRDWVGYLGNEQVKTPNLDRFAARGVHFTRSYCASPCCNPSRAALLTGMRPGTSGVYNNNDDWRTIVPEGTVTIPLHFKNNGYYVAGAGKIYHGGSGGVNRPSDWEDYLTDRGFGREDDPDEKSRRKSKAAAKEGWDGVGGIRFGALECDDADMVDYQSVSYILKKLGEPQEKPFFFACGLHKPHMPWSVPKKYYDLYPLDKIELPKVLENDLDDVPPAGIAMAKPTGDHAAMLQSGRWKEAVQAYLATITFCDAMVGRLIDTDSQMILPELVLSKAPLVAQIMFFGALLSAIKSCASATLLAPSVTIAENILKPALPNLTDRKLLFWMRVVTFTFTVLVTLYAMYSKASIFKMVENAYQVTLVAAFVPLLCGLYWRRATNQGALASIFCGIAVWLAVHLAGGEDPLIPAQLAGLGASLVGMIIGSLVKQGLPHDIHVHDRLRHGHHAADAHGVAHEGIGVIHHHRP